MAGGLDSNFRFLEGAHAGLVTSCGVRLKHGGEGGIWVALSGEGRVSPEALHCRGLFFPAKHAIEAKNNTNDILNTFSIYFPINLLE